MSRLRAAREEHGWTQEELATRLQDAAADQAGVPGLDSMVCNVRRWERGAIPHPRYRVLCCTVLHRSQWELFGIGPPPITELTTVPVPAVAAPASCLVVMLPPGCEQITVHLSSPATIQAGPRNDRTATPLTLAGVKPTTSH